MTDADPTRRLPPVQPPAVQPPTEQPWAPPPSAQQPTRWVVDAGRYWAGALATALVAALVGVVGVIVTEQIIGIDLVVQDPFGTGSHLWAYVVGGALAAVLAAALLHLLVLAAPRPRAFFSWIVGLLTVVATLLPLTWTDDLPSAIASGVVNLVVGLSIASLLGGVLSWTYHPRA